jgi:GTPase SAR1 family protein
MARLLGPQYKVILLGDPGVGKTTYFLQLRDSSFVDTESRPSASLGVEDMEYKHMIGDTEVRVRKWPLYSAGRALSYHVTML